MSPIAIFLTLALLLVGNAAAMERRQGGDSDQNSYTACATATNFFTLPDYTDCAAIPNASFPTAWQWALNSPYTFDYSIGPQFLCSQETFLMPRFGDNTYSGSAVVTAYGSALTFNYNMSADGTHVSAYVCGQDPSTSSVFWYPVAYASSNAGSFYCAKMCNGTSFLQFVCLSNTKVFAELEANIVAKVQNVPNGDQIVPSQGNCPDKDFANSCQAFYSSLP